MVHPIPASIAKKIKITDPPARRSNSAVKLVFAIDSIASARLQAPQFGGELNPPERMFEARGFRACDGHDPEGNVIQFREDAAVPVIKTAGKGARKKTGVDYDTVRAIALALPDVVDSSTLRGIAFKVRGRLLACKAVNRSASPETLMVRVGAAERDRLIAATPEVYYVTPHYLVNGSVLVRMAQIDRNSLQQLFETGWTFVTAAAARRPR
jgi:hypothetical protein